MSNANRLREMLPQFTGTEYYSRHPFLDTQLLLTDGCAFLRENAQCYWLFDIIAQQLAKRSDFIVKLKQSKNGTWFFTAKDSRKEQTFYTQRIPYSDFPLSEITIWVENGVALLPSEH
jgi:hypothetical protein